ncbi:cytochrome bd-I oxidase subunit CydX [Rubrimonas cliftonensis]|uniref:Cyd operon protein YbgT n=1 Tax=Rubrimonas cliftonensis TaxID=89524 RepID=A0A1H3YEZ2_9RHOB|nr:cytochrome bd-I oxidase subunit CydX [Rubrimonas cliftonensis]SEA10096.1 cyd operon protein YbgT [Rubrimonas cliftonensis]
MWYFAWALGLPLAAMFAVVNAMWLEMREDDAMAAAFESGEPRDDRS